MNIKYSGNVSVKVIRGKTVIKNIRKKNNGKDDFFKALLEVVSGNVAAISLMPSYIDILSSSESAESILYNPEAITNKSINGTTLTLSTAIPGTSFKSTSKETAAKLALINNNETTLAEIKLNETDLSGIKSISNNMMLLVNWTLEFSNPDSEDNNQTPEEGDTE